MDIEIISKIKKRNRTDEQQKFFLESKKQHSNKKYYTETKEILQSDIKTVPIPRKVSFVEEIQEVPNIPDTEEVKEEKESEHITPEMLDAYLEYRLQLLSETKTETKPILKKDEDITKSVEQVSFLEQLTKTALNQALNVLIPVGLAMTLQYCSSITSTQGNQQVLSQPRSDMFTGSLN